MATEQKHPIDTFHGNADKSPQTRHRNAQGHPAYGKFVSKCCQTGCCRSAAERSSVFSNFQTGSEKTRNVVFVFRSHACGCKPFCVWIIAAGHRRCANSQFPVLHETKSFSFSCGDVGIRGTALILCHIAGTKSPCCSACHTIASHLITGTTGEWNGSQIVDHLRHLLMFRAKVAKNLCPLYPGHPPATTAPARMFMFIKFSKTFNLKSFIHSSDSGSFACFVVCTEFGNCANIFMDACRVVQYSFFCCSIPSPSAVWPPRKHHKSSWLRLLK